LSQSVVVADRPKIARKTTPSAARSLADWRQELEVENELAWLFVDIHRLLTKEFDGRVKSLRLTRAQWRVLFTLRRTEGGMTQTELAEMAETEKAPLGKILDRLEDSGWIVRKNHPTDRRARRVYATSKIDKFSTEVAAAAKATFARTLQGVRQSEVKDLIARLQKLKRNLGGEE
jgi:MarR family transcriptional regulator, transcriptional regulator for hemolysin